MSGRELDEAEDSQREARRGVHLAACAGAVADLKSPSLLSLPLSLSLSATDSAPNPLPALAPDSQTLVVKLQCTVDIHYHDEVSI